jgi:Ca2+-binding RTX toxin-like protein
LNCQSRASGYTPIVGTFLPDVLLFPLPGSYCVFGQGGIDTIITGIGPDFLSGGNALDFLTTGSAFDVVAGRAGNDVITLPVGSGTAYGGLGHDVIEITGGGIVLGGPGNDEIVTILGQHAIYPGPGRDFVTAGIGDDQVVILDVCEVEPFEVLDGGFGNDTLVTPVPLLDLIARGVIVVGFENIVVDASRRHLSECF